MPNRLAGEKSPYLLQHSENPVAWYPWGEEALGMAAQEDKPIFLSIGYSTCHWCHVMERESFENEEVAALLNEHFISIKVDREERPDIDQVYMSACQAATGRGGWPLSIFMTPEGKPFYAGSYFPVQSRHGMPGFMDIIGQIARLWKEQRGQLDRIGGEITAAIQPQWTHNAPGAPWPDLLERAERELRKSFDPEKGGFGSAPKFPTPHNLNFLLRRHKKDPDSGAAAMVEKTADSMRAGGIFDQVGFGFHRYSVDRNWLVPHFEKMLYDQALVAMAYIDAFLATGAARHADSARKIFEYVLRDMKDPEGGFYSAEDADSEGREGTFYTWTPAEVEQVLDKEEAYIFCRAFGITNEGNFEEGRSIPHIAKRPDELEAGMGMKASEISALLERARPKIFEARKRRIHPFKDDKVLVAWNGLMIAALARGFQAMGDPAHAHAAIGAADFVLGRMQTAGRLRRRYRQGEIAHSAFADDYAFLIWGLLDLYESVFEPKYLEEAVRLQMEMIRLFWDPSEGGFFYVGKDAEKMIVKEKPIYDGAVPSSNSAAALNLLRLARMTGDSAFEDKADILMKHFSAQVSLFAPAYTHFLQAVDFLVGPTRQIVIAGDLSTRQAQEMVGTVHRLFLPNRVLMVKSAEGNGDGIVKTAPFTAGLAPSDGGPTAYVCEDFSCRRPVTDSAELADALEG